MTDTPNIVWITLDSIRTDHTTMGGYQRETTPELQRIANQAAGISYDNCFAHANCTRISTASIITGTYPSHHGVRGDRTIPVDLKTVPELLSEKGYHTVGISRNANSSMGFNRGFDEFQWIASSTFLDAVDFKTAIKYAFNIRKHSAGLDGDTAKHATPFIINDMAKRRISSFANSDEPFFMYLHYNEPHRPYYPPLPYLDRFTGNISMSTEEAAKVAVEMHYNADQIMADGVQYSEEEWEALFAMYDAEIAYTDECVGRLFDHIQSCDLDDTVVLVTADHGELFGEHDLLTHKIVLHDALINVPMVVHGLDTIDTDPDDLVQHGDFMQTLVAMAGGDTEQFQCIDLRSERRDRVIAQDWERDEILDLFGELNPDFDDSPYHRPLLTCLRDKQFKYQYSEDGSELFKLPEERVDVSEMDEDVAAKMARNLEEWLTTEGEPISDTEEKGDFSDAMKEQLSDLGYLVE